MIAVASNVKKQNYEINNCERREYVASPPGV